MNILKDPFPANVPVRVEHVIKDLGLNSVEELVVLERVADLLRHLADWSQPRLPPGPVKLTMDISHIKSILRPEYEICIDVYKNVDKLYFRFTCGSVWSNEVGSLVWSLRPKSLSRVCT